MYKYTFTGYTYTISKRYRHIHSHTDKVVGQSTSETDIFLCVNVTLLSSPQGQKAPQKTLQTLLILPSLYSTERLVGFKVFTIIVSINENDVTRSIICSLLRTDPRIPRNLIIIYSR